MTLTEADDRKAVGRGIQATLDSLGLTQKQLAAKLAKRDATVSDWCCGRKVPSIPVVLDLERKLGVPQGTVFVNAGLVAAQPAPEAPVAERMPEPAPTSQADDLPVVKLVVTRERTMHIRFDLVMPDRRYPWPNPVPTRQSAVRLATAWLDGQLGEGTYRLEGPK